jgi:hypothetical protein
LTLVGFALLAAGLAQNNPVPQIVGPVHPDAVPPGSGAFALSVYGANFVPGSVVNWGYEPRSTTYISAHEVQAEILATDIGKNTAGFITVTNPAPGGGSSSASWAQVEVHDPVSSIKLGQPQTSNFGFWQLQAADFNHDAILDILGECYGLCLELGTGNGTFKVPTTVDGTNDSPTQFGYGDFNNDGNIDVVSFSLYEADNFGLAPTHMRMLFGDGRGDFTVGPGLVGNSYDFRFVTVGDFNQDGNLDLVTKNGEMATYLGNGDGTFRFAALYDSVEANLPLLLSGDIDGDGKLDLILADESSVLDGNMSFEFLKGNGDGTFEKRRKVVTLHDTSTCGFQGGAQLSDLNGDGKLDLAICTSSQIIVLLGNGDGTFRLGSAVTIEPNNYGIGDLTFAVGDINSDGKQDLLVYEYYDTFQIVVFLGNGDGTFQPGQVVNSAAPSAELGIQMGDFNDDGLPDLAFQNAGGMFLFLQQ